MFWAAGLRPCLFHLPVCSRELQSSTRFVSRYSEFAEMSRNTEECKGETMSAIIFYMYGKE